MNQKPEPQKIDPAGFDSLEIGEDATLWQTYSFAPLWSSDAKTEAQLTGHNALCQASISTTGVPEMTGIKTETKIAEDEAYNKGKERREHLEKGDDPKTPKHDDYGNMTYGEHLAEDRCQVLSYGNRSHPQPQK